MTPTRLEAVRTGAGLLAALILSSGTAGAWTPAMDRKVAREAARLMPPSLRGILEAHADQMAAGAREAGGEEGGLFHSLEPGQAGASAASRTQAMVEEIVAMIDGHRPFAEVARRMGALAHFIGDLNNPLQVSGEDPREEQYAPDYAAYVESNLPKFPLVFYGWADPHLDGQDADVRAFAAETARRARRYYRHISKAYAPGNPAPLARRFDVRSLPFGVGSLSYSRSVTDTAKIWLHIWKRAHGDIRGTPYLAREPAPRPPAGGSR